MLELAIYDCDIAEIDDWLFETEKIDLQNEPYKVLAITNNRPICFVNTDGVFERIIYDKMLGKDVPNDTFSNTSQLGIRIINSIIDYDGLGESGYKWYYLPSNECLKGEYTKTLLLIPKRDFTDGI